jgi:hypothetical protein
MNLTFKERADIAIKQLSKQQPTTLEGARQQSLLLKEWSLVKDKKKGR